MSVREYKQIFDDNNYKSDSYEMCLFISFLTKKSKPVREMEELTGLKKSQIHSYKKIIKFNKTEELKTTAFRKVLKSCTEAKPKVEDDLVEAIEKLNITDEATPYRSKYERAHFFREMEYSPGKSSYSKNDFCPCGMDTEPCRTGQNLAHIPHLNFNSPTFLRLVEISGYEERIYGLEKRIRQLEAENKDLKAENKALGEALERS